MASTVEHESTKNHAAELAAFITELSYDDIPEDSIRLVERCFIDTLGVAIAGASAEAGTIAAATSRDIYGDGQATVLGHDYTAPVPEAVFVNGTASHALDYDDVTKGMDGHPSPPMVAPILALAEWTDATGEDMITAYVAGFETQCYIAAPNLRGRTEPGLHMRGWHPTAVFGTFGSAAAAASLLDLDPTRAQHAINIAASMASGLRNNFGSLTKPMHAGQSGANGVRAALLAKNDFTAIETTLDKGFFPVFEGVTDIDPAVLPTLGDRWAIVEDGVDIKKYPSCHATHTAIRTVSELTDQHNLTPEDIDSIHLDINRTMRELLTHDDPQTEAQAKFSLTYTVAAAIVFDYIGIATFEPDTIKTPAVQQVRERVSYAFDPDLPPGTRGMTVTIETTDGETYTKWEDQPPATHENPLQESELNTKFMECATRTLPDDAATAAFAYLDSLRDQTDITNLTTHLTV